MKRQSRSFEIALSAIGCAVAVCALTLGAYVDFLLAAGFLIAVFALMVPLAKDFVWGYVLALIATVILSFLFTGFVVGVMRLLPFVVFFGWHPLLNYLQKKIYQKELAACRRICRQGGLVRPCHVAGMGGACADFRAGRADMVPVYCG